MHGRRLQQRPREAKEVTCEIGCLRSVYAYFCAYIYILVYIYIHIYIVYMFP